MFPVAFIYLTVSKLYSNIIEFVPVCITALVQKYLNFKSVTWKRHGNLLNDLTFI